VTRESIINIAVTLLHEIPSQLAAAIQERKWVEDWLQAEIANSLRHSFAGRIIEREKAYPNCQEWWDVWCGAHRAEPELRLEPKCCVTNYVGTPSDTTSNRPITQQLNEILRDIDKLKQLDEVSERVAMFLVYPMPDDYESNHYWTAHLERLRATGADVCEIATASARVGSGPCRVVAYGCWV
jgi:hypothetical protein